MESVKALISGNGTSNVNISLKFNFAINSVNVGSAQAYAKGRIFYFETYNCATWSLTNNGVVVATNISQTAFMVNRNDSLVLTITRVSSLVEATWSCRYDISSASQLVSLIDYTISGSISRYAYVLRDNNALLCIDTGLLTLSNLKTITAVTNNGTSLTLTCNAHGLSNGNTISLVDLGGFTADPNHKPFVISNVTTNTFDITTTVTGTWNSVGYLAGAWISNPIIASLSLSTASSASHFALAYSSADKTIYVFGGQSNSYLTITKVNADDSSGLFNLVKNWDGTISNAFTTYASGGTSGFSAIYDPIRDVFVIGSLNGIGIFSLPRTPASTHTSIMNVRSQANGYFFYNSQIPLIGDGNSFYAALNNKVAGVGIAMGGDGGYSAKTGNLWLRIGSQVRKVLGDENLTILSDVSGSQSWIGIGCAVDALDKFYFFRNSGSFSYGTTFDFQIWDTVLNTFASSETDYVANPGAGASLLKKAVYSPYSGKVLAIDNGPTTNGRLHIFDTTRAASKKYIGYVATGGVNAGLILNTLYGL